MNRTLIAAAVVWVVSLPAHLDAAVFQRDWKTPGDGLLTYDDVNQREWLDLSASRLDQFSDPRLENAISQIAPGGKFEGFIWAQRTDVVGLLQSAGIAISTSDYPINGAAIENLINLLGSTVQSASTMRSVALINEVDASSGFQLGVDVFVVYQGPRAGVFVPSLDDFVGRPTNGLMLYRTVPEPSSIVASVLPLIYLLSGRFSCRRK
ncbi:MAG: hypothetical protein U0805_09555 [Pirellulales bacterium]